MKHFRYARNVLVLCLVMALTFFAAYWRWGQPDLKDTRLAWLQERRHDFNILFFGSSISRQNVDPLKFDEAMKAAGFESRSFTLGMRGADMHQINWAIRTALGMEPGNLAYVFIDLRLFDIEISEYDNLTPPMIRWHDLHETLSVMRTIELADAPPTDKRTARKSHLQHFLYKYVPVGMVTSSPDKGEDAEFDPELMGYVPCRRDKEPYIRNYKGLLNNLPAYFEAVERKRRHEYDEFSLNHYNIEALREQIALIVASGATPIYWTAPTAHSYAFVQELEKHNELPHLLKFDDAERYPHLYELELRTDHNHLNVEGTETFMPVLVETFLSSLNGPPDLPPVESRPSSAPSSR